MVLHRGCCCCNGTRVGPFAWCHIFQMDYSYSCENIGQCFSFDGEYMEKQHSSAAKIYYIFTCIEMNMLD